MCVTFFYLNPGPTQGSYRLILAMNRDELFARKTAPASWNKNDDILCGRDLTPGKEGGTWLAIDKFGRIGLLTNIFTGQLEQEGKGRGSIIIDYLSGKKSADSYLDDLAKDKSEYNPFNICLFYVEGGDYHGKYYCRGKSGHVVESMGPCKLDAGCHGLGNHPMSAPFEKTSFGLNTFKAIVESCNDVQKEKDLLKKLSDLMKDDDKHCPDKQMLLQGEGKPPEVMNNLSSIFIDLGTYGTRTQTYILIDYDFNVKFLERNRPDGPKKEWLLNDFAFKVDF